MFAFPEEVVPLKGHIGEPLLKRRAALSSVYTTPAKFFAQEALLVPGERATF